MIPFRLLDELRTLAQNGLHYADNRYDRERYERILELSSQSYGEALDLPADDVLERFRRELGHVTPKIGADAAVFDDDDRILLVRRSDDRRWALPCGWVEPWESPEQAAVRETFEETGLRVEVLGQVEAVHRFASERNGPHAVISLVFLAERVGGELTPSHETPEVDFWNLEDVADWHKNHRDLAARALSYWRSRRDLGERAKHGD